MPQGYDPSQFPAFAVTVDVVILTMVDGELQVLLVRRGQAPFKDMWAIPGGFKLPTETLDEAASRELAEETGVDAASLLAQFGAYGDPRRDPRMNVVTVGYLAVLRDIGTIVAGTDAADASLVSVAEVLGGRLPLAFDHLRIVSDAIARVRTDLEVTGLATAFVGPTFTLAELRAVYEAVWGVQLDSANFRRSVTSEQGWVVATGRRAPSGSVGGKPAELFEAGSAWQQGGPIRRPRRTQKRHMNMRAVVHHQYGGPEVLSITDVPQPAPAPDEVLIEVHAAAVNRTDTGFRVGTPIIVRFFSGWRRPKRPILGTEVAGVVEAVGDAVDRFAVGDRVFGVNANRFGTHAEFVCMRQTAPLAKLPDSMSFVEGAGVCDGVILAQNYLRKVDLGPQHRIVVYGASGAIGTAAVQLAKRSGAHVTAVCSTKNLDLMRQLGADEVIDYTTTDFTQNGQIYDIVFDAVGKHSYRRCRRSLVKRGTYMATDLGPWWQNPLLALATKWLPVRTVLFPIPPYRQADVELVADLFGKGEYQPVIDRTYPLDQVVAATTYVETEQKTGNVVLVIR